MKRILAGVLGITISGIIGSITVLSQTDRRASVLDNRLVGNVYGTVTEVETSKPISGAEIFLLDQTFQKSEKRTSIRTNKGNILLPPLSTAIRRGVTDEEGKFLINFVPTPFPFKSYTIVVKAPGYPLFLINEARVLPGAVMALKVTCKLTKRARIATFFEGDDPNSPLKYRHQEITVSAISKPEDVSDLESAKVLGYRVFATREGLVGGTTANGHVIRRRDRFVALPSRRALNDNDRTRDFQVKITYKGRSVAAPVWDVGPWNIFDDYWNPENIREIYAHLHHGGKPGLGIGVPEAQVAFLRGYNRKWSGDFGGKKDMQIVRNPAGIDLADGTFLDDLKMRRNDWVTVEFLWRPDVKIGDSVQTTGSINVRSRPAGSRIGQESKGARGKILSGPQGASYSDNFYVWWNILWRDGLKGWSAENWLRKLSSTTETPPPSVQEGIRGDFNGDGQPDILWQHKDGRLSVWFMRSSTRVRDAPLTPYSIDPNWKITGTGDFNGDGQTDMIGQHTDGRIYVWFMNGITLFKGEYLSATAIDPNWKIAGTGDFNRDGQMDILWRHTDGRIYTWFMKGTVETNGSYFDPNRIDPNWRIAGTGDFNRDSQTDLLWQRIDGQIYIWLMNGITLSKGVYPRPNSIDPNWEVGSVADFNRDGHSDILWLHTSGRLSIWFMNGTLLSNSVYTIPDLADSDWKVIGPR
jgi:hypothetical protein